MPRDLDWLARLALALGPCPRREELQATAAPPVALEAWWAHRLAYSAWQGARTPGELLRRVARLEERLRGDGVCALLAEDAGYPAPLRRLARAPAVIWVRGELPVGLAVAMVGSRAASRVGLDAARRLAYELARRDVVVVSGGALGIDAAAHDGALAAGGRSVAVIGSGIDRLYPERNLELLRRLTLRGAVLTGFPPGTPPRRWHFPVRNRLIAALSQAVVVVEARRRSGALLTAEHARALGVPVLALPGSPGGQELLAIGAGQVTSAEEVLSVLAGAPPRRPSIEPEDADQRAALALLSGAGRPMDELSAALGWRPARTAAALLRLELAHLVRSLPGGRFARVTR
jgi:DNA processing protein